MRKAVSFSLWLCTLLLVGSLVSAMAQTSLQPLPPVGPNNCDDPNQDVPHGPRIPITPNEPQPPAGPPCSPKPD